MRRPDGLGELLRAVGVDQRPRPRAPGDVRRRGVPVRHRPELPAGIPALQVGQLLVIGVTWVRGHFEKTRGPGLRCTPDRGLVSRYARGRLTHEDPPPPARRSSLPPPSGRLAAARAASPAALPMADMEGPSRPEVRREGSVSSGQVQVSRMVRTSSPGTDASRVARPLVRLTIRPPVRAFCRDRGRCTRRGMALGRMASTTARPARCPGTATGKATSGRDRPRRAERRGRWNRSLPSLPF